jgi:hypothetical protein
MWTETEETFNETFTTQEFTTEVILSVLSTPTPTPTPKPTPTPTPYVYKKN